MKFKGIFSTILVLFMALFFFSFAFASGDTYLEEAETLKQINVFKGSGDGFELGREPTRLEGGIMFVRLLGGESEALEKNYSHPFKDVPSWASPYVGYLYKNDLTKGVSDTTFGSNDKMLAKSYITFVLRALEYDDQNGDFSWNDAIAKSKEIHMIDVNLETTLNSDVFLRDHLAKISLDTLKTNMKDKDITLAKILVTKGAITEMTANKLNLLENLMINDTSVTSSAKITNIMKTINGVHNYKDLDGKRFYRPLSESELSGIFFDSLETMEIHNNEYTINELKTNYKNIDWDSWMKIKWGKFDWNDNNHGSNLAYDSYWQDYDGNTTATADTYAKSVGLRLPTEKELKSFFNSLETGLVEDLGWPTGYFWASDVSEDGYEYHRFVDSLNNMGQHYNDTRDYFVILVSDEVEVTLDSKNSPPITKTDSSIPKVGIFPSSQKIKGMTDIPGVANSISIDGVLIYRPLTTKEAVAILGKNKYDYSIPGNYGYSKEKTDEYVVTIAEQKEKLKKENPNVNWDAWLEIEWPIYDNSIDPHKDGPGIEYEGDYSVTDGDITLIYLGQDLTVTPKYLLDKLLEEYPNGKITSVFGWPTNYDYITSSKDEFGNVYTSNIYYESSKINLARYQPVYVSLMKYSDVIYDKLTESSLAE